MAVIFARGNQRTVRKLHELRRAAHAERAPRVALRIQGILLSLEKRTSGEIARALHVDRTAVYGWIRKWNEYGADGILEGHRSGRRARLSDENKERLYDIVESGPVAYGLNTGVWSSPILAELIHEEFHVQYHPGHVRKLLRSLGLSVQRPTTQLVQANEKKRNRWVRYDYPNLKKKPVKKKAGSSTKTKLRSGNRQP